MSRPARIVLILLALLLVCCSLLIMAYANWPVETMRAQATLAPTLLTPP
jgi:hypothetical protein